MEQGFTLLRMGWQWDVPDGRMRMEMPIATEAGGLSPAWCAATSFRTSERGPKRSATADTRPIRVVSGENYLGGTVKADSTSQGWVTAVDASTGKVRWRYRSPRPMVGAVTATAGGLIFAGELTGDLIALDVSTGKVRFRHNTGGPVGGGIVSYEAGGKQYIAVASGRPSRCWVDQFPGAATITVFALDGGR